MLAALPRSCLSMLRRLGHDRRGATAVMMALAATALLGFAGVGVDVALWQTSKRDLQGAADQAAYSAAITALAGGTNAATNAKGVTANMGFVHGHQGVTVTVNNPPTAGSLTGNASGWEVIVTKLQPMRFANLFLGSNPTAAGRAVAGPSSVKYCILVMSPTGSNAMDLQGTPVVNTTGCSIQVNSNNAHGLSLGGTSQITTDTVSIVGNYQMNSNSDIDATINTGTTALSDPYASRVMPAKPSPCVAPAVASSGGTKTYSPGCYPSGINISGNNTFVFSPGIYWIAEGQEFRMSSNGATITGNGVTFVLVGNATVNFTGNSALDFKAPTTGATAGIVIFQDRNAPSSTSNTLTGGAAQKFTGALYFPTTALNYNGNASSNCTQVVAYTVSFQGTSSLQGNCSGTGTEDIVRTTIKLVE